MAFFVCSGWVDNGMGGRKGSYREGSLKGLDFIYLVPGYDTMRIGRLTACFIDVYPRGCGYWLWAFGKWACAAG